MQWIALCVHHTALIYLDLGRLRGLYERGERLIAKEGRKKVGEKSQKRSRMLFTVVFVGFCSMLAYAYYVLWWKHEKMRESLRRQGIKGPHHSFLYGSIPEMKKIVALEKENRSTTTTVRHNYSSILFPYFDRWREQYGLVYMYSTGNIHLLYVSDPDIVKEVNLHKSFDLGKPSYLKEERGPLFGEGILTANGLIWAHQRKTIAPQFFMDKVKGMVDIMVESAIPLLKSWESRIDEVGGIADIRVDEDLRSFSADVISRACFGSSYSRGKEIFSRIRALQHAMSESSLLFGVPGLRYLPTKNNRKIWGLVKEVRSLILNIVNERRKELHSRPEDLLQTILEGSKADHIKPDAIDAFVVDNCKNIYFAGHETTANAATWTLMLLAHNTEWQDRARAEVAELCGGSPPDVDTIRKMKVVTMVIQESLRLYPPAAFLVREALTAMKLGGMRLPKGIKLWIPIQTLHQNPEIWGHDSFEFNPERFANGISNACKHPHVYMPFGLGSRICLGQNFAMVELKMIISMILGRFTFAISPHYRHSPAFRLSVEPKHGVSLLISRNS